MSDIEIEKLLVQLTSEDEDTHRTAARELRARAWNVQWQELILTALAKRLAEIDTVKYLGLTLDLVIELPKFNRADCGIAEAMAHAAGSESGEVRWKACHHLSKLGERAVSVLPLLRTIQRRFPDDDNVKTAILALGGRSSDASDEAIRLLQLAKDQPEKRYDCITKLGLLKAKVAVPFLIQVLSDPKVSVGVLAASAVALGQIGDPTAKQVLQNVLPRAESLGVGHYVIKVLNEFGKDQGHSQKGVMAICDKCNKEVPESEIVQMPAYRICKSCDKALEQDVLGSYSAVMRITSQPSIIPTSTPSRGKKWWQFWK